MGLIEREKLLAEYDRAHVGPPGGARKLIEDAPEVKPKVVAEIKIDGDTLRKLVDEAIEEIKAELFGNSEQLDTISRQAAIDALRTCYETETISMDNGDEYINYGDAVAEIEQLPTAQQVRTEMSSAEDLISRQAALDEIRRFAGYLDEDMINRIHIALKRLPSAQPEITHEQAIDHLEKSGWMQNHDKQMYEMGLRERLADDSDSYDALLPPAQPTISSQDKESGWVYGEDDDGRDGFKCDRCGFFVAWNYKDEPIEFIKKYHYCPNCGRPKGEIWT